MSHLDRGMRYPDHIKNRFGYIFLECTGKEVSGLLRQIRNFYNSILGNEEWKSVMEGYGQTTEKLEEYLEKANGVATAAENVKKEMGDAQNATQERDTKFEELTS